jgi:putative heme-binding domain-containing protein
VIEDADGSLLVVDTGGWYKLCCPTSQLHKPDILGAVYRVRKKGVPRIADPRGAKLAWAKLSARELAALLDDGRPAVVRRALHLLGKKGTDALAALAEAMGSDRPVTARRNAVWTATRIDDAGARALVRRGLADADDSVRQAALHSVSLWRDKDALREVQPLLKSKSAHVRRVAAEALGRMGEGRAVPALLEALAEPADRFLGHSLIYALIEIGDREAVALGLASASPRVRRAALIALDQMASGKLEAAQVAKELTSPDPSLKGAAWWIAGRHPDWGGAVASFFRARLAEAGLTGRERDELAGQLARFAKSPAIQELLAGRLRDGGKPEKLLALRAMAGSALKPPPADWVAGLTETLAGRDDDLARAAVAAARALPLTRAGAGKLVARLLELAGDERRPADVRLGALAAVPGGMTEVSPGTFAFLRAKLDRDQPVQERGYAVEVLTKARLTREQLSALADLSKTIGPMELERLLDAFARTTDEGVGKRLVSALRSSPVRSGLRVDGLKTRLAKYGPAVQKPLAELCAELDADAARQRAELDRLVGSLKGGDVRRGQLVFNSQKAACASCHAIGYLGGKVGPDLTRIGQIRSERDLLEAILYPSASFVRSYEPVQVTTTAGKVHNGLVRKDTPEEVVLAINATEEVRVPRSEIEDVQPSKVSIMPAGMDKVLTAQELADLVAFLRACK